MKKKALICVIIIALILVGIVIGIINKKTDTYSKSEFVLDNDNKYIITTNTKWISMQNDGGSHTNIYYEIDLNENNVAKRADKYVGFEGYEYKEKMIFSKKLNETEKNELKLMLDNAIKNGTEKTDKINFNFYLISSFNNKDIKVYDKDVIDRFKDILEK